MKKDEFRKPGNECRSMKLTHDYPFTSGDREERRQTIKKTMEKVKRIGYGGLTTNTPFCDYLGKTGWEDMKDIVEEASIMDMRLWIYDEKGYPSGTAGGLTLKDHPEYEAKALVSMIKKLKAGEVFRAKKPLYHDALLAAYAFRTVKKDFPDCADIYSKEEDLIVDGFTGEAVDLMRFASKAGGLKWIAGEGFESCKEGDEFTVCVFWTKRLFERTHACQNFHECRRYISVINEKAVGEFIKCTYEEYKKHVGKHFGREIEAFFTDEPSLMAGYLDGTVHPGKDRIKDEPHEDIPLLPDVQWETFLPDEFRNRYGYSLMNNLHYLYAGTSSRAVRVRYDFNTMLASLYEHAYFGQIEKFCHESGVDFSGHVLMEEYLLHHGIWEGNIFRIMSHLDIPGIDVLTTLPADMIGMAVTPKLISSASCWFGKKGTMSEISAHEQNYLHKAPYGAPEMKGCGAAQYALGVNVFQSYFGENALPEKEYSDYNDYLARIGTAIHGGVNSADIILYYPIEGVLSAVKGSGKYRESREYSEAELSCERSWNGLAQGLLRNRLDYIMADAKAIEDLYIEEDGEGAYAYNPISGCSYKAVVIPKMIATDRKFLESLADLAQSGITVIFDSLKTDIPSLDGECGLRDTVADILSMENVINCADASDIPAVIRSIFVPQVEIEGCDRDIIYTKREATDMGLSEVFLLVNTGYRGGKREVLIDFTEDFDEIYSLDPETGAIKEIDYDFTSDGRVKVCLDFEPLGSFIIGAE